MATYDFTVRVTDSAGAFANRTFSLDVNNNKVDKLVAIGNNHAYTSMGNGEEWKQRSDVRAKSCAYGSGTWIGIYDNTEGYKSVDGVNWEKFNPAIVDDCAYSTLKFFGDKFVLVGGTTNLLYIWTSTDGTTWTKRDTISTDHVNTFMERSNTNLAWNGDLLNPIYIVTVGYEDATYPGGTWTCKSTNFTGWTRWYYGGDHPAHMVYANGLFVGHYRNDVITSIDGTNWRSNSHDAGDAVSTDIAYGDGRWLINRDGATMLTSLDGINWSEIPTPLSENTYSRLAFHNGLWYLIDKGGYWTSRDGLTWSTETAFSPQNNVSNLYTIGIRL